MPLFAFINQSKSKSLLKKIFRLIYFVLFVKSIRLLHQYLSQNRYICIHFNCEKYETSESLKNCACRKR
jgi:hypothetical protein